MVAQSDLISVEFRLAARKTIDIYSHRLMMYLKVFSNKNQPD